MKKKIMNDYGSSIIYKACLDTISGPMKIFRLQEKAPERATNSSISVIDP
jgi:hypothetical protein